MSRFIVTVASIIGSASIALSSAQAHDMYTGYVNKKGDDCCSNVHCTPMPTNEFKENVDGSIVISPDARGNMSHQSITVLPESKLYTSEPSRDSKWHKCFWGEELKCVIKPYPTTSIPSRFRFAQNAPSLDPTPPLKVLAFSGAMCRAERN